ncbi:hypothetical protein Tco_0770969 [Tanacetum coccineum]|uniref:Uncharacterized protein n=1 Tax=Tanacetum coccineum TaxID=301880 RepID=A0ABQ4ZDN2_9ASTR
MIKQYLDKTKEILKSLNRYSMEHVRQDHNKKAGALSKLALMTFSQLAKEVLVEVLHEKPIVKKEVANIINEEVPRKPKQEMTSINLAWPFSWWGIDIVGPLLMAPGGPRSVTTKEKVQKKNDVKARSMLLMALPNEHLMTFNQYKDAKTLFAAIQTRFGGFRRLNKPDLDTMSFDDLYNNFKIVEQEVKGTTSSSSSSSSQNMAFVSSPSSTNEVNTAYGVSTANTQVSPASTQVSTASTQVSTANLSDATVYAFLANQPNGSQLVYEDLEQIHEDDLEEMDLKWQLNDEQRVQGRFSRKLVERSLSMGVTQLDMTSPRWSVSTATRWDTLQGNAEDLGTKIAGTGIKTALEGL